MSETANYSLWDAYADQFKMEFRRGNFESARNTLACALSDAEDYREIDPSLFWCLHSLSGQYRAQGDYHAATKLLRLGLEIKEKVLGSRHPDVVNGLEKLALFQLRVPQKPESLPATTIDIDSNRPLSFPTDNTQVESPKLFVKKRISDFLARITSKLFCSAN